MAVQLLGSTYTTEIAIEPQAYAIAVDSGLNQIFLEIIPPDGVSTKVTPTTRTNPSGTTSGLVSHNVLLDQEGTWQFNFLRGESINAATILVTNWAICLAHKDFATRLTVEDAVVPPAPPAQDSVATAQEVAVLGLSCPVRSWYRWNSSESGNGSVVDYYGGESANVNNNKTYVPSIIPLSSSQAYPASGSEITIPLDIDYLLEFYAINKEVLVEGAGVGVGWYVSFDNIPAYPAVTKIATMPLVSDPGGIDLTHEMNLARTFTGDNPANIEITDGLGTIGTSYRINEGDTVMLGWYWGRNIGADSYNYMGAIFYPSNPDNPATISRGTNVSSVRTPVLEGQSVVLQNINGQVDDMFIITTTGDAAPVSTIRQCFEDIYVAGQGP